MACTTPGIPEALHSNGRLTNQEFDSDHKLFIRVDSKHFGEDSPKVSVNAFTTSAQSTNRSKFSDSTDVLYNINAKDEYEHFFSWGVVGLGLAELTNRIFLHPEEHYKFCAFACHVPEECMYPHTEILFRKEDGQEISINSRKLKMIIKGHYLDILTIEKYPSPI